MNKSRLRLASLVLLALVGGLLIQRNVRNVEFVPVPPSPTQVIDATPASALVAPPAKTTAPAVTFRAATAMSPAAASGPSIDSLLTDAALDDNAVIAGLARVTLDATRDLPERTEALGHLLNLSVQDPSATLLPLVADARLPDSLCNQILDDALNAPEAWQADACLAALTHRKDKEIQTKAREHLTFLVGADHGDNLAEWARAIALSKKAWTKDA